MTSLDLTLTIITFALGGTLFFLALTIWRDNFSATLNRVTGAMLLFAGLAPVFWALGSVVLQNPNAANPFEESWLYNLRYLWELFFPTLIIFALLFPINRFSTIKRRYLGLLFIPHIFHLVALFGFRKADALFASLTIQNATGFFEVIQEKVFRYLQVLVLYINILLDSQDKIFPVFYFIYAGVALTIMYLALRQVYNPTFRRQAQAIFWGVAVPATLYVAVFVFNGFLDITIDPHWTAGVLAFSLVIFITALIWSIVGYQFLNLRLAVRQSMVYTISTGLLVGLYFVIIDASRGWIEYMYGGESQVLNIAFIVLALIFFQPLSGQIDELIRRLFLRSRADYRTVIEEFSRKMIAVFEPTELRGMIEHTFKTNLLTEGVTFAIYDDRVGEYTLLPLNGGDIFVIERHDIFLGAIGQLQRPTPVDDLSRFRQESQLAPQLDARKVILILPLNDADRLLGFLGLAGKVTGGKYTADDLNLLSVLSNQLVAAMTKTRLYAEAIEKRRLEEEVALARQIQIELLPKKLPSSLDYAIAAHSTPSRVVGGDLYDIFTLDEHRVGIVIADASGKGMPAAMLITQIQAMLRSEINNNNSIERALENINNQVARSSSAEKFATLFYGIYDSRTRAFEYANAGHNYPALVRRDGALELLKAGGLLIGAFPGAKYDSHVVHLAEADFIFFYTDGLTETMNDSEEEYGEKRLMQALCSLRAADPDEIISHAIKDVDSFHFVDPPQDDRTIVVLRIGAGREAELPVQSQN